MISESSISISSIVPDFAFAGIFLSSQKLNVLVDGSGLCNSVLLKLLDARISYQYLFDSDIIIHLLCEGMDGEAISQLESVLESHEETRPIVCHLHLVPEKLKALYLAVDVFLEIDSSIRNSKSLLWAEVLETPVLSVVAETLINSNVSSLLELKFSADHVAAALFELKRDVRMRLDLGRQGRIRTALGEKLS